MISLKEKTLLLKRVKAAVDTARAESGLYKHIDDPALMEIWKTLWKATDLISAALHDCTRELSKPLVEVERREPDDLISVGNAIRAAGADAQHPEQQPAQEQP